MWLQSNRAEIRNVCKFDSALIFMPLNWGRSGTLI